MGLGYPDLAAIKPDLIWPTRSSGFGLDGPYADRGGFDLIAQGMSGIMSFTGEAGADRPVAAGVPLSDLNAGTFAAMAVLAALNHRHLTGEGQHVETSLLESALAYTVWESGLYLTTGEVAKPQGTRHRLAAPYEAVKTGDGFIVVGVNNQRLWERFCDALGDPAPEGRSGLLPIRASGWCTATPCANAWIETIFASDTDRDLGRAPVGQGRAMRPDQHHRPGLGRPTDPPRAACWPRSTAAASSARRWAFQKRRLR